MRLEIDARLPQGAQLALEVEPLFLELAKAQSPYVKINPKTGMAQSRYRCLRASPSPT